MSIESINSTSNISFKGEETKTKTKETKTPEEIKNGKKKLALALGGLAITGTTAVSRVCFSIPII